jgi:hypothetical protein
MKQKILESTINFKCDGGSEPLEQVLCVLLIAAENFQINASKHVTKNLEQMYFAGGNFHFHAFRHLLRTNVKQ